MTVTKENATKRVLEEPFATYRKFSACISKKSFDIDVYVSYKEIVASLCSVYGSSQILPFVFKKMNKLSLREQMRLAQRVAGRGC